jgi:hypothetical protein
MKMKKLREHPRGVLLEHRVAQLPQPPQLLQLHNYCNLPTYRAPCVSVNASARGVDVCSSAAPSPREESRDACSKVKKAEQETHFKSVNNRLDNVCPEAFLNILVQGNVV